MSRNNILLKRDYNVVIYVNGQSIDKIPHLQRLYESDKLQIEVAFAEAEEIKRVYLHTDTMSADWQMIPFKKVNGIFVIELSGLRGGRSAWRIAAETNHNIEWEPAEYHQVLADPDFMKTITMYTLIPNVSGTMKDWTRGLKTLKDLGFNAVHILPFTKMGSSESPYAAADLFSIDNAYADSVGDFKSFSAEAVKLGITICLDIVLNHVSSDNILCSKHAEWVIPDKQRADKMKRAGCYHQNSWISWEDLVLLNYDHPDPSVKKELYEYMYSYVEFWIRAAGEGRVMIRLDNLHSSNENFIKWLLPAVRKKYPEVIILSEFFGADYHIEDAVMNYGLNLVTGNSWEYPFAPGLQRYIDSIHKSSGIARYLLTPVSHDTGTAAQLFGKACSSVPRYAACALMGTGITGIVQGYEDGVSEKIDFIGRKGIMPEGSERDFRAFISAVNKLLQNEPSLSWTGNVEFFDTGCDSLIVCRRRDGSGESILIAVNLDINKSHSFNYSLIGTAEPLLYENAEVKYHVSDAVLNITLGACGACAVRTMK